MGQSVDRGIARRIVEAVKGQVHAGRHRPGGKLPSTRALAVDWGASRTTVTAAYGQLVAEGYIVTRPGARAVVAQGLATAAPAPASDRPPKRPSALAGRLLASPMPADTHPARIADFRYGDVAASDFPVLAWQRALRAAGLRRPTRLRYGAPAGLDALRYALQGYLWRARGLSCAAEDIVIVNGSQQGLDLCSRLLLDPGDAFIMENPGYVLARRAFQVAGGVALPIPVDRDGLRTDDLPRARLAYVTPSHQYPLGGVLPASRRRALVAWAERAGACIVEDDYDGEYRHGVTPIPPLRTLAPDAVVYVGTFSKTLSPTLRLGYLVVPPGLRTAFVEAKRLTDRHAPLLEQEAIADLIEGGAYERHVRSMRRRNAERRCALLRALADGLGGAITVEGADAGLHVVAWLEGIGAEREAELVDAARAAGIGIHPVSDLYDPASSRPAQAGLVLGYAALDADALRRGVAVLARLLGCLRQPQRIPP